MPPKKINIKIGESQKNKLPFSYNNFQGFFSDYDLNNVFGLLESLPEAVIIVNDGKFIYANSIAIKLCGAKTPQDLLGKSMLNLMAPEFEPIVQNIYEAGPGQEILPKEMKILRLDGKAVDIEFKGRQISLGGGVAILGLLRDITRRKKLESEIRKNNEFLEKIFSNIHAHLAYLDKDFNFMRVNKAFAEAGGFEENYFIGKNHFDLYPHKENQEIFERVVKTGQSFSVNKKPFEYRDQPEKGVTYWDWTLLPVKEETGEISGLVLFLIDVTEKTRSEQKLIESYKHLGIINRKISILLDIHKISGGTNTEEVTRYIVQSAINISGSDVFHIYNYDKSSNILRCVDPCLYPENQDACECREIFLGHYDLLWPLVYPKVRVQNLTEKNSPLKFGCGIKYYVFIPITSKNDLKGALFFGFKKRDYVATQELDFFDAFAAQVEPILHDLNLFY